MPKKRISMRGMGADAFFNPPAEKKEEPVSQDTSSPDDQQISVPVQPQTSVPSSQDAILPVNQSTSIPVTGLSHVQPEQSTSLPESQKASEPIKQHTGKPAGLIKATYYIYPDQDLKLERIRLARRMRGEKVDKSELIREAIDRMVE